LSAASHFQNGGQKQSQSGKRVPYDILNNSSSVDLFYEEKSKKNIFRETFRYLPDRAADSNKTGRGCK